MSANEYLAVAAGLVSVWYVVDLVADQFAMHQQSLLWTLAIPF